MNRTVHIILVVAVAIFLYHMWLRSQAGMGGGE